MLLCGLFCCLLSCDLGCVLEGGLFGSFTGNGSCFRSSELCQLLHCVGAASDRRGFVVDVLLCVALGRWMARWTAWVCVVLGDSIGVAVTAGVPDGGLGHGGLLNFAGVLGGCPRFMETIPEAT